MSLLLNGTIKVIGPIEQKSDKFSCRMVVIETNETYPQLISFQFSQARIDLPDAFREGDHVTISFNLRGREANGRYYNTLEAWKIE